MNDHSSTCAKEEKCNSKQCTSKMKGLSTLIFLFPSGFETSWAFPLVNNELSLFRETQSSCFLKTVRRETTNRISSGRGSMMKWESPTVLEAKNGRNDDIIAGANKSELSENEGSSTIWNPELRRFMGGAAALGTLETAYLTYAKISGDSTSELLCTGTSGASVSSCASVLDGPYSVIPFTDNIPIASLGLVAYTFTVFLAIGPLSLSSDRTADDTDNRILLAAITTAMGTFSVFLMSILFGVLHTTCAYCIISAILSIGLASASWIGGCIPFPSLPSSGHNGRAEQGLVASAGSFLAAVMAAVVLFISVSDSSISYAASNFAGTGTEGVANSASSIALGSAAVNKPPPITTTSSDRAMTLSKDLRMLNARMYGAYWCSHCYDQKEAFGKEAFSKIQYVECSKDGFNSQNELCKEKKVPGYPTWEINGKLFPGEQELNELEDIVKELH